MKTLVVNISDCQASAGRETALVTYALGSCIGVAVHDRVAAVGGLLHVLLPEASLDAGKALKNPCMFADTGLPVLIQRCLALGASKPRMRVWIAGGSAVMDEHGIFNIGKRNHLAIRKALWKAGLIVHAEDVGGTGARTIRLDLSDGTVWIRAAGAEKELKATYQLAKGA
jgi:chemotaxis protein CheD